MKNLHTYPLNPLSSDRALGSAGPLLRGLINKLATCIQQPATAHYSLFLEHSRRKRHAMSENKRRCEASEDSLPGVLTTLCWLDLVA